MNLTEFLTEGQSRWAELDRLSKAAGRRAEQLPPAQLMRLVELYRATAADLAIARRRFPRDPIVGWLESRVVRTRGQLFDREGRRQGVGSFFGSGYWNLLYRRRRAMALSAAILILPAVAGFVWARTDPTTVTSLIPPEFGWLAEASTTDQGFSSADLVGFSAYLMANNIRVTLLAFALGITWGLMTGFVLAQNGLLLGVISGLAVGAGNTEVLIEGVAAHGILELSCIVVGGGAGLAMGRAMLRPGTKTRLESLGDEAKDLALLVIGTAPWLVVAGLVESYVSRTGTDWIPSLLIGLELGVVFWGLMLWRGREPKTS